MSYEYRLGALGAVIALLSAYVVMHLRDPGVAVVVGLLLAVPLGVALLRGEPRRAMSLGAMLLLAAISLAPGGYHLGQLHADDQVSRLQVEKERALRALAAEHDQEAMQLRRSERAAKSNAASAREDSAAAKGSLDQCEESQRRLMMERDQIMAFVGQVQAVAAERGIDLQSALEARAP